MSLLSSTQGSPERVWSVLRILGAHGGALGRDELLAWLNPVFRRADAPVQSQESAASQSILAALSLELIASEGKAYAVMCEVPQTFLAFADAVHTRLCGTTVDDPDRVLLEAYAWIVLNVERENGFGWFSSWRRNQLADAINHILPARDQADEGRRFNETKLAPWRGWLSALGLLRELPTGGTYPYVSERLARELSRSTLPIGVELPAQEVLAVIAQRMPYLDNGALQIDVHARTNTSPRRHLSRILSVALRDLEEEGRLIIGLRGDSSAMVQLAHDPRHQKQTVAFFTLKKELADG